MSDCPIMAPFPNSDRQLLQKRTKEKFRRTICASGRAVAENDANTLIPVLCTELWTGLVSVENNLIVSTRLLRICGGLPTTSQSMSVARSYGQPLVEGAHLNRQARSIYLAWIVAGKNCQNWKKVYL